LNREYPDRPIVGVGGVVIADGKVLLVRRASEPLRGQWSLPGGGVELGETLEDGVRRELREETGLEVRIVEMVEAFERIVRDEAGRIRYHFVLVDYLCEPVAGEARAGSDVLDVAWATRDSLACFELPPKATSVIEKAFALTERRSRSH
jgi:mutator protein MutT